MRRYRKIELIEPYSPPPLFFQPPQFIRETSIYAPKTLTFPSCFVEDFALDLLNPNPSSVFDVFDTITDLVQIEKSASICSYKRVIEKRHEPEFSVESLCDRVSKLESRFEKLVKGGDRKYTWTAEIKGAPVDRKYKWTTEINEENKKKGKEENKKKVSKSYRWSAKIDGKGEEGGPISRKYTFEASTGGDGSDCSSKSDKKDKEKKKIKKDESATRVVEIDEASDHGVVALRQAFLKRAGAVKNKKGKNKELSPQDAAVMIQMTFRAYLIRRSQTLRALRDLAVAKSKLKEIRALFHNFSYRRQLERDAGEQQSFTEKIIVLLLTVDAIEGVDVMVRGAKKSIIDELEAMLDVVDPQPAGGKSLTRRRTFDMPDGVIRKEIAAGVAQVVQMIDDDERGNRGTFEACL